MPIMDFLGEDPIAIAVASRAIFLCAPVTGFALALWFAGRPPAPTDIGWGQFVSTLAEFPDQLHLDARLYSLSIRAAKMERLSGYVNPRAYLISQSSVLVSLSV
jgi:hypothetical protein